MPLSAGDKFGPYEILAPLGAGGMGEVYRAHDRQLGRDVAIKVLPFALAQHPDRLARFDREAKVLAVMNHPNIAAIYGLEEISGTARAIVMELVEGPTLAERLSAGALPTLESLKIAVQIADALEAAHERGVVHRDLKPANVKAPEDGAVKVLDFGLATAVQAEARSKGENSPTLTIGATEAGVILGTAAYMSPEQAAGKPVDRRADIWSFGVVLWEMLTGQRLFGGGETVSHTLADVLRAEIPFAKLPAFTPSPVRALLQRCLDRDIKTRLRDIGEARIAIQKYLANPVELEPAPPASQIAAPRRRGMLAWIIAAVVTLALAAVSFLHFREQPPPAEMVRFQIPLPEDAVMSGWAPISPDGRMVAFGAQDRDGRRHLWVRPLDVLQARSVAETSTANALAFWSPDSRSLAYFSDGKLKRVDIAGGPPVNLCDVPGVFRGGSWSPDGTIIYGTISTGLFRVSQAGGVPAALTTLRGTQMDSNHAHPAFLPDGRHFLYLRLSGSADREGIYVGSLDNAPDKQPSQRMLASKTQAEYAASPGASSGHLLFLRDNTLMAQPFDPSKLALSGDPVPVADPLFINSTYAYFSVSASASALMYLAGTAVRAQLTWFDRTGKALSKPGEPLLSTEVTISPDGSQAAMVRNGDVWVLEFARNSSSRLTSDPAPEAAPVWSPDGKRIVYSSARAGAEGLVVKNANGATPEEQVLKSSTPLTPTSWSRDGKYLLYTSIDPQTNADIWMLPAPGSASGATDVAKPKPFLQTADNEGQAQFSPDGKWVVYESGESGTGEIYVRSFPDAGNKVKISTGGGLEPSWSADGKEIFYRNARRVMAVPVTLGSTLRAGSPKALFEATITGAGALERHPNFIVSPDGKQFLALVSGDANNSEPITVLLNWQALLKK